MARVGRFIICLLGVASFSMPAYAWKNVSPKKREEEIPYRPQWVTVLKKGKLFKYKRKEASSPKVFKDFVFVGSDGGYFYALKKKNGHKLWRFKTSGSVNSTPAFRDDSDGGRVFFGDDDGILYALSIATGQLAWKAEIGSEILTPPAISGNRVFVTAVEGEVAALDAGDGRVIWSTAHKQDGFHMSVRGNSPPVIDEKGDRLYVGFADGTLSCLSASAGKSLWEKNFKKMIRGFDDIDSAPLSDGERLYVATFDGGIYALSGKNGSLVWSQKAGSGVAMAIQGERLYVSGSNGKVYAFNRKDGTRIWESPVGKGALTAPLVYQDLIAVGLSDETMNFLDTEDGHVIARRFARKGVYSDPVFDGDRIYYLSNGGRIYSLRMVR